MFKITIKADDILDDVYKKLDINKPTMQIIGQVVESDILLNFRDGKDPSGKKWTPLKPNTVRKKLKKSGVVKMLQDTGNLKKSLNYKAYKNKVKIGYGAKYSIYHQMGTKYMPIRKILPTNITEIDIDRINEVLREYFKN